MSTQGGTVALNYGYNWITGQKLQGITLQNTGNVNLDYTRIGFWLLGEGMMDGLVELWDTALGLLYYQSEFDNPAAFHFHPGCDAVIGSGSALVSTGGDQGVDQFWESLPTGLLPLHYNRWAYYAMRLKQVANGVTNPTQSNPDNWVDLNPIGLWRGLRCRTFTGSGSMTSFAFTRNPAWEFVDLVCRRKLFPEFLIDSVNGAQDLPAAVKARFDWGALAETAAYCGTTLSDGNLRFAGDFSFSSKTTLQSCISQILTSSRCFLRERNGQLSIVADQPRASVFTFSRKNADSLTATDGDVSVAPNLYNGVFRDLYAPACSDIASIVAQNGGSLVTTVAPHPFAVNDYVVLGNTGTNYDGNWQVTQTQAPDANGDSLQLVLGFKGTNYPANVGAGGLIGLRYSRFKERHPQFEHHAHQLAKGAVGVGIPRQRNRRSVDTDFGNCTWSQVSRVSYWQRIVALGADTQPYLTPAKLQIKVPLFAPDAAGSGAIALQIEPGDHVTIDSTLSSAYAGEYEVTLAPVEMLAAESSSGTVTPKAGNMTLTLRSYSDSNYPDVSPSDQPGIPTVPLLPGNTVSSTGFPLADGGTAAFFTGAGANATTFTIPDGFSNTNTMAWGSPQGYSDNINRNVHYLPDCDAYVSNRLLALLYNDGGAVANWSGDVNFSGIAWNATTSAVLSTSNGISWVEFTLLGGEKVIFGKGALASGTAITLPAGYTMANSVCLGFPKSSTDTGNGAHGFAAWVDSNGTISFTLADSSGHNWTGQATAFVVAWQNNKSSWTKSANGWASCPLPNGQTFAVLGASILDATCNGTNPTVYPTTNLFQVPTGAKIPQLAGMPATSLQVMTGPNGFVITSYDCNGVQQCSVDLTGKSVCVFSDDGGHSWAGSSGVFGLLCDKP